MRTVISEENTHGHIINKYNFKVLSTDSTQESTSSSKFESDDEFVVGASAKLSESPKTEGLNKAPPIQSENTLSKSSKDELIESLLEKTDAMSSNFIKMQMKLESKEEEYKVALEEAKKLAFEEGKNDGIKEAQALIEEEHKNLMTQFASSVETLEKSTEEFSSSIEGIKEELIHAAIDIAKEVVLVEISENSNLMASTLAQDLIKQIQSSSQVTIKVNPHDKVALEKSLGSLENVKIISDNAVSNGGVVILSDAGNIDGDIMKRFERVKSAALGK
ncbi:MAG: flagellar assembly protein FliH [Arcobacter sp.]|nr:MAG: flagellar assembly protein FliH [Arcobacter sp.]